MSRTLALNKTIKLDEFVEGWEGTFITVAPMLSKDMGEFVKSRKGKSEDDIDTDQLTVEMVESIKKKFVRGKVYVEKEEGGQELVDMEREDIDSLPFEVTSHVFGKLVGSDFDPKAGQKVVPTVPQPTSEEASTEMPS